MDRRTRICLLVILIGLANFLAYTVLYITIGGGEAVHGQVRLVHGQLQYFLQSGKQVSHCAFLYSGIHSISIWPTTAAVMLAMLTLAKDRIMASMHSGILGGRSFVTLLAVAISCLTVLFMVIFISRFAEKLSHPIV